jgi:hypothetical protein
MVVGNHAEGIGHARHWSYAELDQAPFGGRRGLLAEG